MREQRESIKLMQHTTAKPSHYDREALHYDVFNAKDRVPINQLIDMMLKKHHVQTVLDLTCGTGCQVFWLTKNGYKVVGSDINAKMLHIAKDKAKRQKVDITFLKGDMRTLKVGQFDAVITIFNAIGHLTKQDFVKAMRNIHDNLHDRGLYIFDIFNLSYLLKDDHITRLTIDWQKQSGHKKVREIQYSTINEEGILASYDICFEQVDGEAPQFSQASQTLQVYRAGQMKDMLHSNGFKVLRQCQVDGKILSEYTSDRIVTIAMKKNL